MRPGKDQEGKLSPAGPTAPLHTPAARGCSLLGSLLGSGWYCMSPASLDPSVGPVYRRGKCGSQGSQALTEPQTFPAPPAHPDSEASPHLLCLKLLWPALPEAAPYICPGPSLGQSPRKRGGWLEEETRGQAGRPVRKNSFMCPHPQPQVIDKPEIPDYAGVWPHGQGDVPSGL